MGSDASLVSDAKPAATSPVARVAVGLATDGGHGLTPLVLSPIVWVALYLRPPEAALS